MPMTFRSYMRGQSSKVPPHPQELVACGETWGIDVSQFVGLEPARRKIDNSLIQDGYNIYHHTFILTRDGDWAVVQQGMSEETRNARRYQWFSGGFSGGSSGERDQHALRAPHGITCDEHGRPLNLVAAESAPAHSAILDFVSHDPDWMARTWQEVTLSLPERHYISPADVDARRLGRMFQVLHESGAGTFKDLIQIPGVGPRTIAALSLVSELVYDAPPSFRDPARFSFAHGGRTDTLSR